MRTQLLQKLRANPRPVIKFSVFYGTNYGSNFITVNYVQHVMKSYAGNSISVSIVTITPHPHPKKKQMTSNEKPFFFYRMVLHFSCAYFHGQKCRNIRPIMMMNLLWVMQVAALSVQPTWLLASLTIWNYWFVSNQISLYAPGQLEINMT